jgi:hypothetical protein
MRGDGAGDVASRFRCGTGKRGKGERKKKGLDYRRFYVLRYSYYEERNIVQS